MSYNVPIYCGLLESDSYLLLSSDTFLSVLPANQFTMKGLAMLVLVAVSTFLVSGQTTTDVPSDSSTTVPNPPLWGPLPNQLLPPLMPPPPQFPPP
uniref:Uncharacterized protein n=1 Tax=Mustela putorius furo TaxID=9669 RepID=M3Y2D6_MUSPF